MMQSFTELFNNHSSIPVGILIDPLLKTLNENFLNSLNLFDFEFFANIAKHPKLQATPYGIQLMDQMAKIYINYPIWASCASVTLIILADRFQ